MYIIKVSIKYVNIKQDSLSVACPMWRFIVFFVLKRGIFAICVCEKSKFFFKIATLLTCERGGYGQYNSLPFFGFIHKPTILV